MLVASVLSHLVVSTRRFWKIKEKKYKRNINNDLAVVTSHIPVEAVHDTFTIDFGPDRHNGKKEGLYDNRPEMDKGGE